MEDVISNKRERTVARRTITESDMTNWPNIFTDDAGRLDDGHVFIGATETEARPVELKHFVFANFRDLSIPCLCYALSADGRFLAAWFRTSDVLVCRLSDGLLVQRLQLCQGHTDIVNSLPFSPNSHNLVSGTDDGSAIVWDIRSGRVLLRLEGHTGIGPVHQAAYAPHGALIATASNGDNSVKIWDASTRACLHSFSVDEKNMSLPSPRTALVSAVGVPTLVSSTTSKHMRTSPHYSMIQERSAPGQYLVKEIA